MQFTPGCIVRKSPISEPLPVTQLIRPLGKPAKWKQWTICKAETAPWRKWIMLIRRLEDSDINEFLWQEQLDRVRVWIWCVVTLKSFLMKDIITWVGGLSTMEFPVISAGAIFETARQGNTCQFTLEVRQYFVLSFPGKLSDTKNFPSPKILTPSSAQ